MGKRACLDYDFLLTLAGKRPVPRKSTGKGKGKQSDPMEDYANAVDAIVAAFNEDRKTCHRS
jgi:hypothetical protein